MLAREHGAISYVTGTTDSGIKEQIMDETDLAGTSIRLKLTGSTCVNPNASFSNFPMTGGNSAGNADFANPEFVTKRLAWLDFREPVEKRALAYEKGGWDCPTLLDAPENRRPKPRLRTV